MNVLHVSAECYPAAKVGGLADVVGALPKYLNQIGVHASVVIPKYDLPWINNQSYETVYQGQYWHPQETIYFAIQKLSNDVLGFPFYVVDIPGKFNYGGVYTYHDGSYFTNEAERFVAFQRAVLDWVRAHEIKPDVLHCHDHHSGLIPFLMQYAPAYLELKNIPSVFTIHNERYQGVFSWNQQHLLPEFDTWKSGLLDWSNMINPLASAIRCSWQLTTVSPSYMEELRNYSFGLESLFRDQAFKSQGILNGIDPVTWDPRTDPMIEVPLKRSVEVFKRKNKEWLCGEFGLDPNKPLISYIGRFAGEKGADLLPGLGYEMNEWKLDASFLVLGSGDPSIEHALHGLNLWMSHRFQSYIGYNEALAHRIYAGSDFLIMPSRVEPCGLNQMYAMRYGTVPIVRKIGGLRDSVEQYEEGQGTGFFFEDLNLRSILHTFQFALSVYDNADEFKALRQRAIEKDFSWEHSAKTYKQLYEKIL